ncbi:carbon-nitrogen hydrolase family protein [Leifsonia sp. EB34]|uniref:carbon-nitrogen hydrolase family protein n=1 Tax=Leifsonia sp. EB34 TaxID=3156303 RepID=UPI003515B7F1
MARTLQVVGVQAPPLPLGTPLDVFADEVRSIADAHPHPGARLVVYPELHLFGPEHAAPADRNDLLDACAVALDSPLIAELGAIARKAGVWLVPGSVCERGPAGELFNTALVFSPSGELTASYRKIFPWRPYEPYVPGGEFVVFDIPGTGRLGLSICYDAWFPEVTRHLAWLGAEAVVNVVKTTTPDRAQEVVLAQANSIVNQTFTVSVNCAGPIGEGRSLIVDPEGAVLAAASGADAAVLVETIDLDAVTRVRESGTAGSNRMWAQFQPTDAPLELPLYSGRIDPARWAPSAAVAGDATR